MNNLLHRLLGDLSPELFQLAFIWALIGGTLLMLLKLNKRDLDSTRTPKQFSYRFMIQDNATRFITAILLILFFLRFLPELLGLELSMWTGAGVGLLSDELGDRLRKYIQQRKAQA